MNKIARTFLIAIALLILGFALLIVDNLPKLERYMAQEEQDVVDNLEDISLRDYKKEVNQLSSEEKAIRFEDEKLEGDVHYSVNDGESAVIHYKKAAAINANDKDILYRLAIAQTSAGQYEDAEFTYKKIEPMDSDDANFWFHRAGNIHKNPISLNNINLAVEYAEKAYALSEYKTDLFLISLMAESYFEQYKFYKMHMPDSKKLPEIYARLQSSMDNWRYEAARQNNPPSRMQYEYIRDLIRAFPHGIKPNSPFNKNIEPLPYDEKEALKARNRAILKKMNKYPQKDY